MLKHGGAGGKVSLATLSPTGRGEGHEAVSGTCPKPCPAAAWHQELPCTGALLRHHLGASTTAAGGGVASGVPKLQNPLLSILGVPRGAQLLALELPQRQRERGPAAAQGSSRESPALAGLAAAGRREAARRALLPMPCKPPRGQRVRRARRRAAAGGSAFAPGRRARVR